MSAIYAGSALAFSGGTLPLSGASWFARSWSAALPYPHYLPLAMDQFIGAPPSLALRPALTLLAYTLVAGGLAWVLIAGQRRRPAQPSSPSAAAAPTAQEVPDAAR